MKTNYIHTIFRTMHVGESDGQDAKFLTKKLKSYFKNALSKRNKIYF